MKTNSKSLEKSSGSICLKKKRQMLSILSSWDGERCGWRENISGIWSILSFYKAADTILCFQEAAVPGGQYFYVVTVLIMTDQL